MIYGFTGHRPHKLGGYNAQAMAQIDALALRFLSADRPAFANVGMALGFDTSVARGCVTLGIPFVAYVPFVGQESLWPADRQSEYRWLLSLASRVVVVSPLPGFSHDKMHRRNRAIVDNSQKIIALWDGKRDGGTYNCVRYATETGVPIVNLWRIDTIPSG